MNKIKQGFSLMEMMVVLLIVAIIAAASAPMVTKKMARNAGTGDSPWVFTGLNNNIAYNLNGSDSMAIIGSSGYTRRNANSPTNPRLVLASGADYNHPALAFADRNGTFSGQINMDSSTGVVTLNDSTVGNNSVAIGINQTLEDSPTGIIAIGQGVQNNAANDAIIIGRGASSSGGASISIGCGAIAEGGMSLAIGSTNTGIRTSANGEGAVAVGNGSWATGDNSIAIGSAVYLNNATQTAGTRAIAQGDMSIALGVGAIAAHKHSAAIGAGANTTTDSQIVLGGTNDTVYIPGNLVVGKNTILGINSSQARVVMRPANSVMAVLRAGDYDGGDDNLRKYPTDANSETQSLYNKYVSDRRLKNVGEKYTAGLDSLKKLDFFHYTFKKDEAKTPHVGVMAQDLQKVFPDAVTKGDDGFLRIRWEDMFYAVINAVKELDNKIADINKNIKNINSQIENQNKIIQEQQKTIEALEKRIEKLEKKK